MTLIKVKSRGSEAIGRRNLVINGDMRVAQRATSKTSITTAGYYTVDRMQTELQSAGTWTMTQSDDVPASKGFSKSFKYDCTTADASLSASDYFIQRHSFEGQDLQRLMYGTSDAKPVTISFYVKSNKTGTYVCELQQLPGDGTFPRTGKSFTIDSANTWERKIITLNGNTAKTIPDSNARGLDIMIWMAAGTTFTSGTFNAGNSWDDGNSQRAGALNVNIADNTANEILFTGLQMEIGTSATEFEHGRSFAEELQICKRYFQNIGQDGTPNAGFNYNGYPMFTCHWPVEMRATPTASVQGTGSAYSSTNASGQTNYTGSTTSNLNIYLKSNRNYLTGGSWSGSGNDRGNSLLGNQNVNFDAEL